MDLVCFARWKRFWGWKVRRVAQQCPCTQYHWTVRWKLDMVANFTLCVFYHNLKNSTINLHLLCLAITGPPLTVPLVNLEGDSGTVPMPTRASLPQRSWHGIQVSWNKSLSCAPSGWAGGPLGCSPAPRVSLCPAFSPVPSCTAATSHVECGPSDSTCVER